MMNFIKRLDERFQRVMKKVVRPVETVWNFVAHKHWYTTMIAMIVLMLVMLASSMNQ